MSKRYFQQNLTYILEACDFVRKCFAKISRRKFLDNLKRATAQDPGRKSSVMKSFLMKLLGMTFRPATSVKKSLHQRCLPVNILELSKLLQKGLALAQLFWWNTACALQDCSFIKMLVHYRLFSQKKTFFIFLNS